MARLTAASTKGARATGPDRACVPLQVKRHETPPRGRVLRFNADMIAYGKCASHSALCDVEAEECEAGRGKQALQAKWKPRSRAKTVHSN